MLLLLFGKFTGIREKNRHSVADRKPAFALFADKLAVGELKLYLADGTTQDS